MTEIPAQEIDPLKTIQDAISTLDTEALCVGFASVIEWLEADGTTTLSVLHTPMPPWHLHGLLHYAESLEGTTMIDFDPDGESEYFDEEPEEDF